MNKIQNITLLIFIISFSILNNLKSQCVVYRGSSAHYLWRIKIHCVGEGYITSTYSDDFNNWNNPTTPSKLLWARNVSNGGTTNSNCTSSPTNTRLVLDSFLEVIFFGSLKVLLFQE